jgi:DNA-binding transcriptional LysR family regulator
MHLQSLQVYCDVVRLQSFSRGAAANDISQSAASQIVRNLERELQMELIDRRKRPLESTPEGSVYYHGCCEILDRHRALLDEMHRIKEEVAGTVRVASIYSAGLHTLSRYIQRFLTQHPGSNIRLGYYHPSKVYAAVANDEADLGVTSYPKPARGITVIPWLEEEMVLACHPNHRLARKRQVRAEDLEGENFVGFDPGLPIRAEIDRALRQRQVSVNMVMEFDNIETIKQAVEIDAGVSILPRASLEREVNLGTMAQVPLAMTELRRPVGIIHRRGKKLAPTVKQFLESLLEG